METNYKNIKKLGLGIVCFDATELLRGIISEIRPYLGHVTVALQKVSYHGEPIKPSDYNHCYKLKEEGLVDDIIEIDLDMNKEPRVQETDKRNLLIEHLEKKGCSHVLIIDSDEFYNASSFKRALDEIDANDYEQTYCRYLNYYKDFRHYLVYPFDQMWVPFVMKSKYRCEFETRDFPLPSDPTRRYVRPNDPSKSEWVKDKRGRDREVKHFLIDYHTFDWKTLKMHHLSWVRANIRKKMDCWSSKSCFDNFEDLIDRAADTFRNFDRSGQGNMVRLVFNSPNNELEVKELPDQYVKFDYDIATEVAPAYQKKHWTFVVMSCNRPDYLIMEKTLKEVYGPKLKALGVDMWIYRKNTESQDYKVIGDDEYNCKTVLCPNCDDGIHGTGMKTFRFFEYLEQNGYDYDYMLRTNLSTWVNVNALDTFLGYLENDDAVYGGETLSCFWSKYKLYALGNSIILPKKYLEHIKTIIRYMLQTGKKMNYIDDFLMGVAIWSRCSAVGIDSYNIVKGLGLKHIHNDVNGDKFTEEVTQSLWRYLFIQVKPGDGSNPEDYNGLEKRYRRVDDIHNQLTSTGQLSDADVAVVNMEEVDQEIRYTPIKSEEFNMLSQKARDAYRRKFEKIDKETLRRRLREEQGLDVPV